MVDGVVALSAAIAVGATGFASGIAEMNIGAAAIGAMAEKEELFGKGLDLNSYSRNNRHLRPSSRDFAPVHIEPHTNFVGIFYGTGKSSRRQ